MEKDIQKVGYAEGIECTKPEQVRRKVKARIAFERSIVLFHLFSISPISVMGGSQCGQILVVIWGRRID